MTEMPGRFENRYNLILLVVCLAAFMGSLDVSVVLIALPSITDYFDATTSISTWIVLSYGLVMTSFMLIFGKLSDRFGFRSIFLIGFILFTISSLLCGMAGNIIELIIFRGAQGLGAAMLAALGPGMVSTYFPEKKRGTGLGYVTTFASLGLAIGPVVGALLVQYMDWRWIFLINLPIGVVGLMLAFLVIPRVVVDRKKPFDILGGALAFFMLLSIVLCLNMGEELEWNSPIILLSGSAGVIFALMFTRHLRRSKNPLLDVALLNNRSIKWANWSSLIVLATGSGAFVLLPFYFQYVKGWNIEQTGFALMVPALAMVFAGPIAGYLSDRKGCRRICVLACVISGVGFLALSMFQADTSILFIVTGLIILGFSLDMYLAPNHSLVMGHTPEDSKGASSALMMTMQDTGEVMGVVIFETVFSLFIISKGPYQPLESSSASDLVPGFQAAFIVGIAFSLVALFFIFMAKDATKVPSVPPEGSPRDDIVEGV